MYREFAELKEKFLGECLAYIKMGQELHPVRVQQMINELAKAANVKNTKVISGFPAVGKSFLSSQSGLTVLDSDSSNFSWIQEGERHPDFPNNYIEYIKNNIGKVDYILVSSHDVVREALKENDIPYTLVYPSFELKDEYSDRYKNRGNNEGFIKFIDSNWYRFISDIESETFPKLVELESGQYLSDVLDKI